MQEFLWQAFVTLFVIIDPFVVIPVFVSLTVTSNSEKKRKIALKSTIIAAILLLSFAFIGDSLLDAMDISEPAFRIAGGFLLLLAAIDMVVAKSSGGFHSTTKDEAAETSQRDDISVFPMAIPLIAGPGALTSVVVLMRQAETMNRTAEIGVILILILIIAITYASLLIGDRIMKVLGVTGTNVLTRVFGIILAALAVQNMINGVKMIALSFINPT